MPLLFGACGCEIITPPLRAISVAVHADNNNNNNADNDDTISDILVWMFIIIIIILYYYFNVGFKNTIMAVTIRLH